MIFYVYCSINKQLFRTRNEVFSEYFLGEKVHNFLKNPCRTVTFLTFFWQLQLFDRRLNFSKPLATSFRMMMQLCSGTACTFCGAQILATSHRRTISGSSWKFRLCTKRGLVVRSLLQRWPGMAEHRHRSHGGVVFFNGASYVLLPGAPVVAVGRIHLYASFGIRVSLPRG